MDTQIDAPTLAQQIKEQQAADNALYILIDLSNVPAEAQEIQHTLLNHDAVCVLTAQAYGAEKVSPWLRRCDIADTGDMEVLHASCELALYSNAVSWLYSNLNLHSLAKRIEARTDARLSTGDNVMLRIFDPRVLPALNQALQPEQQQAVMSLGAAWLYLDQSNQLKTIKQNAAQAQDAFSAPLHLSDAQETTLMQAGEIDAIVGFLNRNHTDKFVLVGDKVERYRFVKRCLARAARWRIGRFYDQQLFCTLTITLGEGFDDKAVWPSLLNRVLDEEIDLTEAVQQARAQLNQSNAAY